MQLNNCVPIFIFTIWQYRNQRKLFIFAVGFLSYKTNGVNMNRNRMDTKTNGNGCERKQNEYEQK